jgi:hypothetical protein
VTEKSNGLRLGSRLFFRWARCTRQAAYTFLAYIGTCDLPTGRQIAKRLQAVTTNKSGLGLLFLMIGEHKGVTKIVASRSSECTQGLSGRTKIHRDRRWPGLSMYADHVRKLRVKVPSHLVEVKGSEAQGRHREAGSEGSAGQRFGPMNKDRMKRATVPGELASDSEAHIHQGHHAFAASSVCNRIAFAQWWSLKPDCGCA